MVENVYPAVLESDALLVLCPNYNDALSANVMAFINRLTSLTVNNLLQGKQLFSIVVSGYSGGDLVAQQLLGALCLNKAFTLPPPLLHAGDSQRPGYGHAPAWDRRPLAALCRRHRVRDAPGHADGPLSGYFCRTCPY